MMKFRRVISAHLMAVLLGSLVLFVGVEMTVFGPIGFLQGLGKWIGGILIFFVLAIASLPAGLVLRALVGRLKTYPLFGAMLSGAVLGFVLMFVLHPAMYPGVSFWTDPVALSLVHVLAGLCGGAVWFAIEFGTEGAKIG
ncbi:MAG: hypothetical protein AAFU86_06970 [Pseudomonadota bacterium]